MGTYFKIIEKRSSYGTPCIVDTCRDRGILFDEIEDIVGGKVCPANGIPYAIEVDGWGELAAEGETYDTEDFFVECISYEEYFDYLSQIL